MFWQRDQGHELLINLQGGNNEEKSTPRKGATTKRSQHHARGQQQGEVNTTKV
jgi:hypothetical protein